MPGYLALGEWSHHHDYLGHEALFCTVLLPPLLNLLLLLGPCHFCPLLSPFCMKCSIDISNFLEEISSLYHSIVPLFLCIDHWGRLSYLSLLFFGTLHSNGYIFPFLLCLSLLFFSQLLVRPPQTTILPFCISFSWGWSWSLPPVQCHKPLSIVLQALFQI